ncbi:MAG: aquaporin, partial [Planctomycetota bacterium]|nr:aquaporin [Planctomycetota bacterium]
MDPIVAEFLGTTILLLLGQGVVANVSLSKTT